MSNNQNQTEKDNKMLPEIMIKRDRPNICTIGFVGDLKVTIYPGITRIDNQEILKLIANKKHSRTWEDLIESGVHKIVKGRDSSKKIETTVFHAMVSDDALKIIKETYSIPALERMYSEEEHQKSRSSVLKAILAQIEDIKKPSVPSEG